MQNRLALELPMLMVALAGCSSSIMPTMGPPLDGAMLDSTMEAGPEDAASPLRPTPTPDASRADASVADAASDATMDASPLSARECLDSMYRASRDEPFGPDYDRFSPTVGSHCVGTNHQDIRDIERVVFLGDSITVGSPPTLSRDFYRNVLADGVASHFSLDAPRALWREYNPFDGIGAQRTSGAFSNCAKWGARTDDFLPEGSGDREFQIGDCFPGDGPYMARTLVIVTMGGNDIANITEGGGGAMPERTVEESWEQTRGFVRRMRSALDWLKSPGRFPNGVFVVFANMYEFTDGTANVSSCPASDVAGIDDWSDPSDLESMVIWANEQYMQMAVETDTDMVFMLEGFCGHGFERENPDSPCYRGPDSEAYFDLTCVHPSPAGHRALASLFLSVITE